MGIGERALPIGFTAAPGLTIVTARNGTGKTSFVDGVREAISDGRKRGFEAVERNLHNEDRKIEVHLRSGEREVEIVCDGDGIRWVEDGVAHASMPLTWVNAFQQYLPILLHPELSPVMDNPGDLYGFVKAALALAVLERLLEAAAQIKSQGAAATREVKTRWTKAKTACAQASGSALASAVAKAPSAPSAPGSARIREVAGELPTAARSVSAVAAPWAVCGEDVDALVAGIERLLTSRSGVVVGADRMQEALDQLLAVPGDYIAGLLDSDTCPVCRTSGAGWAAAARAQADDLRELVAAVTQSKLDLAAFLKQASLSLPPDLGQATADAVRDLELPDTDARLDAWRRLSRDAAALQAESVTVAQVRDLAQSSDELARWYGDAHALIEKRRQAALDEHSTVRAAVIQWLDEVEGTRTVMTRAAAADGLAKTVTDWIKETRAIVFAPISQQVTRMWRALNADGGLDITDVQLGGGVQKQQKVKFALAVDGTPIEEGAASAAILSTGQRNALSLAAYFPRAMQATSPFGFLILDDPIHAFNTHRVRYLAHELISVAETHQVIVFTHDDRLWQEVRAAGPHPTQLRLTRIRGGRSHVTVETATWPGEPLLDDVDQVLRGESRHSLGDGTARSVMTLAACRQAVDTAVTVQNQILGRRGGKSDEDMEDALDRCRGTRSLLALLGQHAAAIGITFPDLRPYDDTIRALNDGSHGRGPANVTVCRKWVRQSKELLRLVYGVR